jgi:hypothetical protein
VGQSIVEKKSHSKYEFYDFDLEYVYTEIIYSTHTTARYEWYEETDTVSSV